VLQNPAEGLFGTRLCGKRTENGHDMAIKEEDYKEIFKSNKNNNMDVIFISL
jgi:hypothetical protein